MFELLFGKGCCSDGGDVKDFCGSSFEDKITKSSKNSSLLLTPQFAGIHLVATGSSFLLRFEMVASFNLLHNMEFNWF